MVIQFVIFLFLFFFMEEGVHEGNVPRTQECQVGLIQGSRGHYPA